MSGSPPTEDRVVAFYSGGRDHRGRTLDEILAWGDGRLESIHDYIQWVFPTRAPSAINPYAPRVTDETARAFSADPRLRARLGLSLARMLSFYGLRTGRDAVIEPDPDRFRERAQVWLEPGDHNHLRLTRIMASLATLGRRDDAIALQRCLLDEVAAKHGGVSSATLEFWKHAIEPR